MSNQPISTLEFKQRTDSLSGDADIGAYPVGDMVKVGHFRVPDGERGSGVGEEVMRGIIDTARAYGAERVEATIGYTSDDDSTSREDDPTVKFLQSMGFDVTLNEVAADGVLVLDGS